MRYKLTNPLLQSAIAGAAIIGLAACALGTSIAAPAESKAMRVTIEAVTR